MHKTLILDNYEGLFSKNRAESSLIAKLFAGYLFSPHIFENHEGIQLLVNDTYKRNIIDHQSTVDTTYFLKIKDLFRDTSKKGPPPSMDKKVARSIFTNGAFDIGISSETNIETDRKTNLILFELKFLTDLSVDQTLQEIELCKSLASHTFVDSKNEVNIGNVYMIAITTFANLHFSRVLTVDINGMVTVPGIGQLPDNLRVITFDTVADVIIKTRALSERHELAANRVLAYMYRRSDAKTVTVDGKAKGGTRHLLHDSTKRKIEILLAERPISKNTIVSERNRLP